MDKRHDDHIAVQVDDDEIEEEEEEEEADEETSAEDAVEEEADEETSAEDAVEEEIRSNPVLLHGEKKMLYWVDRKTNQNFLTIFAGGLTIVNYEWWKKEKQLIEFEEENGRDRIKYKDYNGNDNENGDFIQIARLKNVCWLQFGGSFDVLKLSSKTWYIVLFEVKLSKEVDEWTGWSTVSITLPEYMNKRVKHEHKVNMKAQEKEKWVEISVGVFNTSIVTRGKIDSDQKEKTEDKIDFSFIQVGDWISGIEVRSAKIQPLEAIDEMNEVAVRR